MRTRGLNNNNNNNNARWGIARKMSKARNILNRKKTIKKKKKYSFKLQDGVPSSIYDLSGTDTTCLTWIQKENSIFGVY
jgi:hypothetical protein